MGVWRCFVSVVIILLIVFPISELVPIAIANADIWYPQKSLEQIEQPSGSDRIQRSTAPQISSDLSGSPQASLTDEGDAPESDGLGKSVNLLRSLLWRMTRHLQQLPIESWLADLEANISHKNEDIALEDIAPDVEIQI